MPPQDNFPAMATSAADAPAIPVFVPQGPPPGLGVIRTIVLALMVAIGVVDLLLVLGIYFAVTSPQDQLSTGLGASVVAQAENTNQPDAGPLA